MEKRKGKINKMCTKVNSWKEIDKLQDAMKELGNGAFEVGWHVLGIARAFEEL